MQEIKIGEYVRFKDGKIRKIIGQDKDNHLIVDIFIYGGNWLTFNEKDNIVKHSSNVIDLIKVGDYVNGYKVTNVCNEEPCPSGKFVDVDCEKDSSESYFFDNEIKTIVTKEQFANAEYRLED